MKCNISAYFFNVFPYFQGPQNNPDQTNDFIQLPRRKVTKDKEHSGTVVKATL